MTWVTVSIGLTKRPLRVEIGVPLRRRAFGSIGVEAKSSACKQRSLELEEEVDKVAPSTLTKSAKSSRAKQAARAASWPRSPARRL